MRLKNLKVKTLIKHFFSNSAGIFVSRILGFLRDLLIASHLGASVWSDIFVIAFKLPNLFRRLFGEGAFTQAFLPHLVKARKKGLFIASTLVSFTLIMLVLTALVMLFAPLFTMLLAGGFDEETIALAVPLVRINFWYLILIFLVTLFASLLQYKGHFATSAFSTALLNISMIAALLLAQDKKASEAVYYLSYGVVAGGALQVILHIFMLYRLHLLPLIALGLKALAKGKRSEHKGFWGSFGAGVLGSSSAQLSDFISSFIASFLMAGSISYLYYANRIFQLPLALFAIALSTAIFPKIARQIKAQNEQGAKILLSKGFYFLLALLLAASLGGIILAKPIIFILFERGEFVRENTLECAFALQMTLVGLLPFGLYKLFSLWLYAKMKQKLAAKISIISLILNVILSLVLFRLGAAGLALAGSLSGYFIFFASIYYFGVLEFAKILKSFKLILVLGANALFAVLLWLALPYIESFLGI